MFRLPVLHSETVDSYPGLHLRKGKKVDMAPAANERIDPKIRASMQSSRAGLRWWCCFRITDEKG